MEGLVIVISVIIAIINFAAKQQNQDKNQKSLPGRQGYSRQQPVQKQRTHTAKPEVKAAKPQNNWERIKENLERHIPPTLFEEATEGVEAEDRSIIGSLSYQEPPPSSEGECDEHPEHKRKDFLGTEKKSQFPEVLSIGEDNAPMLELTEEDLLRSIVMAEILGPPRALKRNIR